jgi:hypothetical protein
VHRRAPCARSCDSCPSTCRSPPAREQRRALHQSRMSPATLARNGALDRNFQMIEGFRLDQPLRLIHTLSEAVPGHNGFDCCVGIEAFAVRRSTHDRLERTGEPFVYRLASFGSTDPTDLRPLVCGTLRTFVGPTRPREKRIESHSGEHSENKLGCLAAPLDFPGSLQLVDSKRIFGRLQEIVAANNCSGTAKLCGRVPAVIVGAT